MTFKNQLLNYSRKIKVDNKNNLHFLICDKYDSEFFLCLHGQPTWSYIYRNFMNEFENRKPLVVVPTSYNETMDHQLQEMGVNIAIYANHLLRAAYPAMMGVAEGILKHGRTHEIEPNCISIKEVLKLIPGTI